MSGDNYRDCPLCQHRAEMQRDADIEAVKATYGKVEEWEYRMKLNAAELPIDPETIGTIREDYEVWIDDNGEFGMYFGARCSKCQTEFDFKVESRKTGFSIDA